MKKTIISIVTITIYICYCLPCGDSIKVAITTHSNQYFVDGQRFFSLSYSITNQDSVNYYLWTSSSLGTSDEEQIKNHFIKRNGDDSLAGIAMDWNIATFTSEFFSNSFTKRLKAHESFVIYLYSTDKISEFQESELVKWLNNHIVAYSEIILSKYVKHIAAFNPIVFYTDNAIVIPIESIIKQIKS
ncbi:MAG: hypothetical protein LBV75_03555 [Paludibacter sp.]|jgi:hypothetical protein|nr:hypothetical protein [Paludibacter sp.]